MNYPRLFQKGKINSLEIKNRVVMSPMGGLLTTANGEVSDDQIAYYEARAKGGVGLIITEIAAIDYEFGKTAPTQLRVDNISFVPRLARLVDAIHKYDTKVFLQMYHAGTKSNIQLTGGKQIVSSSNVPYVKNPNADIPRSMTKEEIQDTVRNFAHGALMCKMAGFDGVEIHGAHEYLIHNFLSPLYNQRTDEYGGSFENRIRFAREVIMAVREVVGPKYPICIRINVDDFIVGGITLEEGVKIAKCFEEYGVDAIHASSGVGIEPISYEQAWRSYLAAEVKKVVSIPVIAVGVIREPGTAEEILEKGMSDFVAIGRGHLADPEWCNKAKAGLSNEIRKCISCLYCWEQIENQRHVACALNALTGCEREYTPVKRSGDGRKVVVVGGGVGGMEAARVLALRGFKVVLFEKRGYLGGQINYANKPLGKAKMTWAIDYYQTMLKKLDVDIRLSTAADLKMLKEEAPCAVFIATGGVSIRPCIKGIDGTNVYMVEQLLSGNISLTGKNVAVIGGGMTGCETAAFIASKGNRVTVIEMSGQLCNGVTAGNKIDVMKHLKNYRVETLISHCLKEITPEGVCVTDLTADEEKIIPAEAVVVSIGVRSENSLYQEAQNEFDRICLIGDAAAPRKIAHAVKEGYFKAASIYNG